MAKNNSRLVLLTTTSVMTALVCIMTLAVRIPSPTKGYINLGDCFVILSGWLLGPLYGTFAGGVGSALSDLIAGYPVYIPGTLLIKGLMAFMVSFIPAALAGRHRKHMRGGLIISSILAEFFMVIGYYLYEAVVIGESFVPALAGVSGNVVQGIIGAVSAYFLAEVISRTNICRIKGINGFIKGGQIK